MSVLQKQELEKELCDALGLKKVQKLDLHFSVDSFATAEVKMHLDDEQLKKIVSVVKKYNLKVGEETSQESVSEQPIEFGTEMKCKILVDGREVSQISNWYIKAGPYQDEVNWIPINQPLGIVKLKSEGFPLGDYQDKVNHCTECNMFEPYIADELVGVGVTKGRIELLIEKDNCIRYLANNGTCLALA